MVKKKYREVIGSNNIIRIAVPKHLYTLIGDIKLEMTKERNNKKVTFLEAGLELYRRNKK